MKIRVRYFAALVDLTGTASEEIEVDAGAAVADLWDAIGRRHAALGAIDYRPLVACDLEYARYETPLAGVDEVAFLPPVSGG